MVDYSQQRYKWGYAAETSHGAGGTPTTPIGGKTRNISFEMLDNPIRIPNLGSRVIAKTVLGDFNLRGSVVWTLGYGFDIGQHLIGPRSGSGTTASPYVLTEADYVGYSGNVIKTFHAQVSNDHTTDDVNDLHGCIFTDVTFAFARGAPITCTGNFIGKTVSLPTIETITTDSLSTPVSQETTFEWDGSSVSRVESGSVTIGNAVAEIRELADRFNVGYVLGEIIYGFTLVVKMHSGLDSDIKVGVPDAGTGDVTEHTVSLKIYQGATSSDERMEINMSNVTIISKSKPISVGAGMVMLTIQGFARQGTGNQPVQYYTVT